MRTPEEFRNDVRRKETRQRAKRKASRRVLAAALVVPGIAAAALAMRVGLAGVMKLASSGNNAPASSTAAVSAPEALEDGWPEAASEESAPADRPLFTLQIGPKPVVDLWWAYIGNEDTQDFETFNREYEATLTQRALSQAMMTFAGDLSPLLYESGSGTNHCYSPLSLYYALALTAQGAQGETRAQLLDLLHAPDAGWLAVQCDRYYRQHYLDREYASLLLANSLWARQGTELEEDFLSTASEKFYASVFDGDFTDPALSGAMGEWVSDNTNGLLKPEFQMDPETVLALLNTVYFKGQWTGFAEENNTVEEFTTGTGETVQATYMHKTDHDYAVKGDGYTRASLGLSGADMVFILPDEGVAVEDLLTREGCWEEMLDLSYQQENYSTIHWSVPKFDAWDEPDVAPLLERLGMTDAFDPLAADFSGMTEKTRLYVSQIAHGARVKIDENGVEAAAYTEVGVEGAGAAPVKEADMKLDRPFLFAILAYDNTEEGWESRGMDFSPLFVGVVNDPTLTG